MREWINVNDELPKDGVKVFIRTSRNSHYVGYYDSIGKHYPGVGWYDCDGMIYDVTHWMKVPPLEPTSNHVQIIGIIEDISVTREPETTFDGVRGTFTTTHNTYVTIKVKPNAEGCNLLCIEAPDKTEHSELVLTNEQIEQLIDILTKKREEP